MNDLQMHVKQCLDGSYIMYFFQVYIKMVDLEIPGEEDCVDEFLELRDEPFQEGAQVS